MMYSPDFSLGPGFQQGLLLYITIGSHDSLHDAMHHSAATIQVEMLEGERLGRKVRKSQAGSCRGLEETIWMRCGTGNQPQTATLKKYCPPAAMLMILHLLPMDPTPSLLLLLKLHKEGSYDTNMAIYGMRLVPNVILVTSIASGQPSLPCSELHLLHHDNDRELPSTPQMEPRGTQKKKP